MKNGETEIFKSLDVNGAPGFVSVAAFMGEHHTIRQGSDIPEGDVEVVFDYAAQILEVWVNGLQETTFELSSPVSVDRIGLNPSNACCDGRNDHYSIFDNISILGGPLEISLDIKPGSCPTPLNTKSKGVLPVAILGKEDFDVTQIDTSTILLKGVAPIRNSFEDVATPFNGISNDDCLDCTQEGPDGFMDLTLKFDTQEMVGAIGEVKDRDCLVLEYTGALFDGTPIFGEDVVLILKKEK